MSNKQNHVISASQVGAYTYCAQAWWLGSVRRLRPSNVGQLKQGTITHERHGQSVVIAAGLVRLAYLILGLAIASSALWLLGQ